MTIVLDAGAISALAASRQRLRLLRELGHWPPLVPAVVLTEALTGDHRRDFHANRLVRLSDVVEIDELLAREAAMLRTAGARKKASAVDAIVVAVGARHRGCIVLTSDPGDLRALAAGSSIDVRVERV
jgi:predicted nucleic acid-binding protein